MMSIIKKAVIPAAGKGTRFYPVTKFIPKELLPICGKPMLHYWLEELLSANIKEICIVINKKKEIIKEYVRYVVKGTNNIKFLYQYNPIGLADAIYLTKEFVQDEPFLIIMPDNIIYSKESIILQLINALNKLNKNVILGGLNRVTKNSALTYGNSGKVELIKIKDNLYKIKKVYDKGKGQFELKNEKVAIRACGIGILQPTFFEYVKRLKNKIKAEFDDTYVYQEMLKHNEELYGVLLKGKVFDCGNIYGYAQANNFISRLNR